MPSYCSFGSFHYFFFGCFLSTAMFLRSDSAANLYLTLTRTGLSLFNTKIARPCPFCGKLQTRLRRHLEAVHESEELVKGVKDGSKEEKIKVFETLRKNGIYQYNLKALNEPDGKLMKERNQSESNNMNVCGNCKAFIEKAQFYPHRHNCLKAKPTSEEQPFSSTPVSRLQNPYSSIGCVPL